MARYAISDEEAAGRYERWRQVDPFPRIAPALLNSADITDYVAATGMIYPFYPEPRHLKPASYEVALGGTYVYWDEDGQRHQDHIGRGDPFYLRANSIVFVTVEPYFRLPEYIAIRFNLKITHIYRGILLGTGPLVDPGFQGRLSIPLHNLTNNDYQLMGGEGLIWMEFTKVSPNPRTARRIRIPSPERAGVVVPLPSEKLDKTVADYLQRAFPGKDIRSSIPDAVQNSALRALEAADAAKESAEATDRTRRFIGVATLVALILGVLSAVGVVLSIFALFNGLDARIDALAAAEEVVPSVPIGVEALTTRLAFVETEIERLTKLVAVGVFGPAILVTLGGIVVLVGLWAKGRKDQVVESVTDEATAPPVSES